MNERKYKLKKYPLRMPFNDAILLDYEDVFQHYEVVAISITGWFSKTLWVLFRKTQSSGESTNDT